VVVVGVVDVVRVVHRRAVLVVVARARVALQHPAVVG
jgi:hypothetical protein